jgi:hypothetical protein
VLSVTCVQALSTVLVHILLSFGKLIGTSGVEIAENSYHRRVTPADRDAFNEKQGKRLPGFCRLASVLRVKETTTLVRNIILDSLCTHKF